MISAVSALLSSSCNGERERERERCKCWSVGCGLWRTCLHYGSLLQKSLIKGTILTHPLGEDVSVRTRKFPRFHPFWAFFYSENLIGRPLRKYLCGVVYRPKNSAYIPHQIFSECLLVLLSRFLKLEQICSPLSRGSNVLMFMYRRALLKARWWHLGSTILLMLIHRDLLTHSCKNLTRTPLIFILSCCEIVETIIV